MLETLYTQRHFVSTPSFDALRANRRVVLTNALVEEFLSYVRGQIVVHQRKGLKGKRLYHILRLLFELERIVAGNEPLIFIPVRTLAHSDVYRLHSAWFAITITIYAHSSHI